jgi:hypothetical protein
LTDPRQHRWVLFATYGLPSVSVQMMIETIANPQPPVDGLSLGEVVGPVCLDCEQGIEAFHVECAGPISGVVRLPEWSTEPVSPEEP